MTRHQEFSGKKMEVFDQATQSKFIPYVIETSIGLDRCMLMVLCDAYREEEVEGDVRTVLKMHPALAPIQVGIFPLVKKPELQEVASKLEADLSDHFTVLNDASGSIGKRYRRLDEIGTPFCITVDFDGLEDQTVTIRDRDTMQQTRVSMEQVPSVLRQKMDAWTP